MEIDKIVADERVKVRNRVDSLWKDDLVTKIEAYCMLACHMDSELGDLDISLFDLDQCEKALNLQIT